MEKVRMNDDDKAPKIIDHDPNEKRKTDGIWCVLWPALAVMWFGTWYLLHIDWHQVALGAFTGMTFASWAIDVTGNKTPNWMR